MRKCLLWAVLLALPLVAAAEDDWQLLKRVTAAGRHQSLSGTYLHQMNGMLETFHIVRTGGPGNVLERRVALDGPPREIVRNGENLTCYAPDKKSLMAAKVSAMRLFPVMMTDDIADISQSYTLHRIGSDRVAQHDCTWLELKARDQQRYSERICAEQNTALPLKLMTLTPQNEVVEQYTFTQIEFAGPHDRSQLKPRFRLSSQLRGAAPAFRRDASGARADIAGLPPGFRLVRSANRTLSGGVKPVRHLVFSDGLVMLSLFVEPLPADSKAPQTFNLHGAINMATARQRDQLLTLVGDLPEPTLSSLVRSIRLGAKP